MQKKVTINQFIDMLPLEVASNFMMEFDNDKLNKLTTLKEYFRGDINYPHEYVSRAFPWDHSVKGIDYWMNVYRNLKAKYSGQITFAEFMELLEPIEQHRLNAAIEHQRGEDLLNQLHSDDDAREYAEDWLGGLINWEETEQGHEYWRSVYSRIMLSKSLNEPQMLN